MRFEFGFYSSMLLIFFVHGIVYALLLFKKGIKNESASDKWLALISRLVPFSAVRLSFVNILQFAETVVS